MKTVENTIQDEGVVEETTTEIEDVATEETEVVGTGSPHKRDQVMDELAANRRKLRDSGDLDGEEGDLNQEVEDDDDEVESPRAAQEGVDEDVNLKVDGEVVVVKQSEVDAEGGVAQIQKRLSGERKLKIAAEKKKVLDAQEIEQGQREANLVQREQAVDTRIKALEDRQVVSVDPPAENLDELTDNVLSNIYKGNEAEAKEALTTLVTSIQRTTVVQGQPAVSEEKILQRAMFEIDRRDGQKEFMEKYSHLAADKTLFEMTNAETIKIENENPEWNPKEIILEAAKRTEAWRLGVLAEGNESEKDKETLEEAAELAERTEKKRANKPIPTAKTRSKSREGFKPRTQSQIFADMKAGRSH
jgi:hypothetical protein